MMEPMTRVTIKDYNREAAINYAHKWAFSRNPRYTDFELMGGDCTNFISQCLHAGGAVMNYTPHLGWYYQNINNRAPAWTGVNFFYNFLVNNKGIGPFARTVSMEEIIPGDIIQFSSSSNLPFHHTLLVVQIGNPISYDNILITTHTYDSDNRPLSTYQINEIRFIHIKGIRIAL